MQIRVLVWLNLALALGVVVWAWFFLPFAHGVACGLGQQCPPLSLGQRGLQTALPGFLIAAVALTGRHLASRRVEYPQPTQCPKQPGWEARA